MAFSPIVPSDSSLENGITPFAMKVFATGMRKVSANLSRASAAPWRMTPFPARITGHFAPEMMRAASSILLSRGAGVAPSCGSIGVVSPALISAMFSGKSMKQAPGFSVWATLKAFRTISAVISGSRI